jgi:hypothetical protein
MVAVCPLTLGRFYLRDVLTQRIFQIASGYEDGNDEPLEENTIVMFVVREGLKIGYPITK